MAHDYDHKNIEKKWQDKWFGGDIYEAKDDSVKPKFYGLIEFPFPSSDGLHTGHMRSNTAMDIICRKRRMEGYNVLYPIGWDAFGLPTENYAVKTNIQPKVVTKNNTDRFREQLKACGFSFDWSREINTTDPAYYKWTQWIFLKLYEQGLAYKSNQPINWCPSCKIGLANEEAIGGVCERCGGVTEVRNKNQWMLAITKYADRLDKDLDEVDFLEKIKIEQRNWIGRSEGAEIDFTLIDKDQKSLGEIKVYTTRPETIFGATYLVLAPEHPLINSIIPELEDTKSVKDYIDLVSNKTEIDRTDQVKEKTGVELKGVKAINPATKEAVPVFIADYVLVNYGTGAIMAVPAHDERDLSFAQKYNLTIKQVINEGNLINSGEFTGLDSNEAKKKITDLVGGKLVTKYKLRDWVFSRQRYWGEPIPMINCAKCGWVPVPESDLPVILPEIENFKPTENGESPLATLTDWVKTTCPKCGGEAKRETDTMPNWAGSSWYFLRYVDPHNDNAFADQAKLKYWTPVDWYNGGMEHTTLHLLYSRFWHKFLFDLGLVPTSEPYQKRTSHGLILAEGGVKMSKSKGNVVNPDKIIDLYGADTLRIYEMFMGPFDQPVTWSTESIIGARRFIERVWRLKEKVGETEDSLEVMTSLHLTIKKVTEDIEKMSFNTTISSLMILVNLLEKQTKISRATYETLLQLVAPFAPHFTEELWSELGNDSSIHLVSWPVHDPNKISTAVIKIVIQVNGKTRDLLELEKSESEEVIKDLVINRPLITPWLKSGEIKKIIYIENRLINIVI